jgi:hypothetical protein
MTDDIRDALIPAVVPYLQADDIDAALDALASVVRGLIADAFKAAADDLDGQWMPAPQWDFPQVLRDRAAALHAAGRR